MAVICGCSLMVVVKELYPIGTKCWSWTSICLGPLTDFFWKKSSHLRTKLLLRFLTFIRSCRESKKLCLSTLVRRACRDQGSITRQNLNFIEAESGLVNVLEMNNFTVSQNLKYAVPAGEEWRINFFNELVQLSISNYELDSQFTNAELGAILEYVCTT